MMKQLNTINLLDSNTFDYTVDVFEAGTWALAGGLIGMLIAVGLYMVVFYL